VAPADQELQGSIRAPDRRAGAERAGRSRGVPGRRTTHPATELLHGGPSCSSPVCSRSRARCSATCSRRRSDSCGRSSTPRPARRRRSMCSRAARVPRTPRRSPGGNSTARRRLAATGHGVLVCGRREFYHMSEFVNRFTAATDPLRNRALDAHPGLPGRRERSVAGALLEALARLFARNVRVYAYPMRADVPGRASGCRTGVRRGGAAGRRVAGHCRQLRPCLRTGISTSISCTHRFHRAPRFN